MFFKKELSRQDADKIFKGSTTSTNIAHVGMTPYETNYQVGAVVIIKGNYCRIEKMAVWENSKRVLCNLVVNYDVKKVD